MRRQGRHLARDQRGTALLETALTLPLMLLVSIGILEFGRAYQTWQILTNAAREGARIAVLPGTTDDAVSARVATYLTDGQIEAPDAADVSIARDEEISIGSGTASASRVTVTYPYEFIVLQPVAQLVNPASDVGAPLTMTASALMRNEQ
ncbi:MAG: TadE/TadG family type IV pilus assembly protein [Vicinamibacterales bacterium]